MVNSGKNSRLIGRASLFMTAAFLGTVTFAQSVSTPANLDSKLAQLLQQRAAGGGKAGAKIAGTVPVDSADRVRVLIKLTGSYTAQQVASAVTAAGAEVLPIPELPAEYGKVLDLVADVPVSALTQITQVPGVQSVLTWYPAQVIAPIAQPSGNVVRPHAVTYPGQVSSQAAGPLGITDLQAQNSTLVGTGVTIAIISDNFNTAPNTTTKAPADIAANNLPGPGNPAGNTTAVVVVGTDPTTGDPSDEGRGMLQLVYQMAPKAKYCFASAGTSPSTFAAAIAALAKPVAQGGTCGANVIVDDIGFPTVESSFGDYGNPISTAINTAFSQGIIYLSSAGNSRGLYIGDWNPISDATARAGTFGNLKLGTVPASLTAGGFQNFSTSGTQLSFTVTRKAAYTNVLYWNDPFSTSGMTSDYNLLVFDAAGNYLPALSSTSDNKQTGLSLESVAITDQTATTGFQFVIAAASTPGTARRLQIIPTQDVSPSTVTGLNTSTEVPSIFGHQAAAGSIGTGAYSYSDLTTPQSFSSGGPFVNYFDASGTRMATPETRQQPMLAGIDNVNTSFFGSDSDGDTFPNFSGTSASAPTASAVAALIFQKSGNSLTPTQVMQALIKSGSHNALFAPKDGYGYINAVKAANVASGTNAQAASTTTLTSSLNPATVGSSVTLTATVGSSAASRSGRVDFFDGTVSLGTTTLNNNVATLTVSTLAFGAHSLSAAYAGDSLNLQSTGTLSQSIVNPTLTVTGFPTPDHIGTANNVTVTVKDASGNTLTGFTGTVTLTSTDAGATLPAAYTYTTADAGVHAFSVTLATSGPQTITATSGSSIGTQTGIYVDNYLWALPSSSGTAARLSETGTTNFTTGNIGFPSSSNLLAFDNSGTGWFATPTPSLVKFSSSTGTAIATYSGGGLAGSRQVAIDGSGRIWIANSGDGSTITANVAVFSNAGTALSPSTGFLATTPSRATPFANAVGLAIDPSGAVWIGNNGVATIVKIFGAATPTVIPLSVGVGSNTLGAKP